jgi:fibronectin type 3 domain-containing protein
MPGSNLLSGKPLSGFSSYRIYRSESATLGSFLALADTTAPSYSDTNFSFDHTYHYRVRAVFKAGASEALSDNSQTVEITPRDVFPPAVPRDVTAIYTAGAVELVWTPSTAPDLAGYNVYRREAGGAESRVNKQLVRTPVFRDPEVQAGRSYSYRVTAVDLSGNESAPSAEAAVATR